MTKRSFASILACLAVLVFSASAWAADTDGDGIDDSLEALLGTNPLLTDTDGDGLDDYSEFFVYGTDPNMSDTDGDGQSDGYEVAHGTDPLHWAGTDPDGGSPFAGGSWPAVLDHALSGASPVDGSNVCVVDGHMTCSATAGWTEGVRRGFHLTVCYSNTFNGVDDRYGKNWSALASYRVDPSGNFHLRSAGCPELVWTYVSPGIYTPPTGLPTPVVELTDLGGGDYKLVDADGSERDFSGGNLTAEKDRYGNGTTYTYTGSRCDSATDSRGQTHYFTYWPGTGRLKLLTMADGRVWKYCYNDRGQLARIEGPATTQFPGGIWQEFRYTNGSSTASLNDNMIAAIDGRGNAWMTATYDGSDRVATQSVGGGTYTFDYTNIASQQTTVTDRNGNERVWSWDAALLTKTSLVERTNRSVRVGEPDYTTTWHADVDGYIDSVTYPLGNGVLYTLNAAKLPTEVRRKTNMAAGNNNTHDCYDQYAYDAGQYYAMTDHWDARNNHTSITLDGNGRPATITYPMITSTSVTEHEYYTYNPDGTTDTHTDRGGTVTQYAYYGAGPKAGRISTATVDPGGLALMTNYDYTDWGDVISKMTPNGVVTTYTVEAYGNVTEVDVGSMGYVTKYEHDGNLNVTKREIKNVDETGSWRSNPYWLETDYTYTVMDKIQSVAQFTAVSAAVPTVVTNYGYDANDNLTAVACGGKNVGFAYDERDLLYQRIRDPGLGCTNATETLDYDGNRNLTAYQNARGFSTTKVYDGFDRLLTTTNALGHYEALVYDKDGHVLERKNYDYNGGGGAVLVAHHKDDFDEMGRRWREHDLLIGGGGTWYDRTMALDGRGMPTTVTDRRGKNTSYVYDALGRVQTRTDALTNHVDFTYWYDGGVATQIETEIVPGASTEAHETDFTYDDLYRKTSQTVFDKNNALNTKVTTWASDCIGAVCSTTDPLGDVTTSTFDALGRMLTKTEPVHGGTTATTTWAYDENGKLTELVDDNGKRTHYDYNALNYLTTTTCDYVAPASPNPTTTVTTFVPDANGNLYQWTDPNGTVVTQTFDDLDRLTARSASLGSGVGGDTSESFAYDSLNRMTQAADNDSTVDYAFDSLSRVLSEAQTYGGDTKTTTYGTWNAEGGLERLNYAGGFSAHRSYDDIDRLTSITDGTNPVASFDLFGAGGRLKTTTLGNTTHTEYAYDGYRRPTSIYHETNLNVTFAGFEYDYDKNDNPLYEARTHKSGHGDVYSYDKLNRLTSVLLDCVAPAAEIASPGSQSYATKSDFTMDGVFNILQHDSTPYGGSPTTTTFAVNALNEYTTAGGASPTYDANGNLLDDGTHTYVYDFHNHLIEAKTGGVTIGTYKYDAVERGRRIRRVANSTTTRYVYAGEQSIEEYDGSNALVASFVFGDKVDQVVMMKSGSNRYYYHQQLVGSVTQVTDGSQSVVESYEYGPYGETTIKDAGGATISATAIGNRYGFTGRQYDEETGLYYYRARHYSPGLRRFVQRDPLEYVDGPNAFAYVCDRPVVCVDPLGTGLFSEFLEYLEGKAEDVGAWALDKAKKIGDAVITAGKKLVNGVLVAAGEALEALGAGLVGAGTDGKDGGAPTDAKDGSKSSGGDGSSSTGGQSGSGGSNDSGSKEPKMGPHP
jgi:RHS repeat-associated protein